MQPAGDRIRGARASPSPKVEASIFTSRSARSSAIPGEMAIELENELGGRELAGRRRRPCLAFLGRQDGVEMVLQAGDGLEIAAAADRVERVAETGKLVVPFDDLRPMTVAIERNARRAPSRRPGRRKRPLAGAPDGPDGRAHVPALWWIRKVTTVSRAE